MRDQIPQHIHDKRSEVRHNGVVRWFDAKKGFGFIAVEGYADAFVHFSEILTDGFRALADGQVVICSLEQGTKGLIARKVRPSQE